MSESKCYAADGKTECYPLQGVGVMVSAAAFNNLHEETEKLRAEITEQHGLYRESLDRVASELESALAKVARQRARIDGVMRQIDIRGLIAQPAPFEDK